MNDILIIYWSYEGNTKRMAELIAEGAQESGYSVIIRSVTELNPNEILRYNMVLLGCPAMGFEELEERFMEPFMSNIEGIISGKKIGLFGSYGWGDGEWMRNWEDRIKRNNAVLIYGEGLIVNEYPENEEARRCIEYGKNLINYL